MQLQIQKFSQITNSHGTYSPIKQTKLISSQDLTMVATTSIFTSTSRMPSLRRETLGTKVGRTENDPVDLEKDMLGQGSSIRTLSLCSDDFEYSEDSEDSEPALRSPRRAASASHIRSRFLNRLGISRPGRFQTEEHPKLKPKRTSSGPHSGSFRVYLKADHGKLDITLGKSSSSLASSNTSIKRSVTFAGEVTVHPIPRFSRYSHRMRTALWTPTAEVQANAVRNCYEFASEGWNWRSVANDEDMVLYAGELFHPIHFVKEQECSMRQQFLQVMSARNR